MGSQTEIYRDCNLRQALYHKLSIEFEERKFREDNIKKV